MKLSRMFAAGMVAGGALLAVVPAHAEPSPAFAGEFPSPVGAAARVMESGQRDALVAANQYGECLEHGSKVCVFVAGRPAILSEPEERSRRLGGSIGALFSPLEHLVVGASISQDRQTSKYLEGQRNAVNATGLRSFMVWGEVGHGPRLSGVLGWQNIDTSLRRAGEGGTAEGNTTGYSLALSMRAAYGVELGDHISVSPFVGFGVFNTRLNGYTESKASGLEAASFDRQHFTSTIGSAGVEVEKHFSFGRLWAEAAYAARLSGYNTTLSGSVLGESFVQRRLAVAEPRAVELGAGAAVPLSHGISLVGTLGASLPTAGAGRYHAFGTAALVMGF